MQPGRRRFLVFIAGLPGLIACQRIYRRDKDSSECHREQFGRLLISTLNDYPSAQVIGRAYLESRNKAPDRQVVIENLTNRLSSDKEALLKLDMRSLRNRIDVQCREEYLKDQTVQVRGWVLPRTEVDICVLAALSSSFQPPRP